MQNISLWWACPWTLSVAAVQAGGLGMVALGLAQMSASYVSCHPSTSNRPALILCIFGLLGVFAVGYPGYFFFDAIWPGFYYSPVAVGKNAWLLGQALFIAFYFVGTILMTSFTFAPGRRLSDTICAFTSSGQCLWASRPDFLVVRNSNVLSMEKLPSLVHGNPITDQAMKGNVGVEHRLPSAAI